jgi:hypothetical protein
MGRRRKSLVERVMEGSFRPRHHAELLADDLLAAQPPEGVSKKAAAAWRALRHAQLDYHGAATAADRREAAFAFHRAAEEFAAALASCFTLAQLLHATIGPLGVPPVGLSVSKTAWLRLVREWEAWNDAHGSAWRIRNGLAIDGDAETKPVGDDVEIPEPPGFDLLNA